MVAMTLWEIHILEKTPPGLCGPVTGIVNRDGDGEPTTTIVLESMAQRYDDTWRLDHV